MRGKSVVYGVCSALVQEMLAGVTWGSIRAHPRRTPRAWVGCELGEYGGPWTSQGVAGMVGGDSGGPQFGRKKGKRIVMFDSGRNFR